jgi:LysM repeat protein
MKRILSLTIFIAIPALFFAQAGELWVKNSDKGLYLEHKVMPKEGLFPLGRMYNVHPRHIAKFNAIDFNKGLVLGQLIKIPLTDTNFNQKTNIGVPVYYKVGEKDGLMRVSSLHNKVTLENLRKWNNLSSDNVNFGTTLVVGYLVSKEMTAVTPPPVAEIKKEEVIKEAKREPVKGDDVVEKPEVKKEEPKPVDVKKEEPKAVVEVKQPEKKPEIIQAVKVEVGEEGYFKWHFEQQSRQRAASNDKTVTSGIFKTTSGWTDGKYYLLIDGVVSGTIVKITNPTTNKSVYAKVLGQMEGINLNKGLDIRISNAAASALGVTETDKFIVKANY